MQGLTQSRRNDEIDFRIVGEDMQFVEIELDPGESAVAEAGLGGLISGDRNF